MCLKSYQKTIADASGRFAPFMFGLLLAVSTFSMTMKVRVEEKLQQEKQAQQNIAQQAAEDLKQALEVDMLLESSYSSTIDVNRARRYLSQSSGLTAGGQNPILDNQTGTTLDGLARQTTLIGVTDDTTLQTAISTDTSATAFGNISNTLPVAVFDAQATRQTQLNLSKQNLDSFSGQILEFTRGNGRMPTTTELSLIATTTGLRTFWGATFSHSANLFSVTSSFSSPWSGGDTYSNTVRIPYYTASPTYTWASATESIIAPTPSSGSENYIDISHGTLALSQSTGGGNTYTYIFENRDGTWREVQAILGSGLSGYGLKIDDDIMAISDLILNVVEIFKRQNGTWQKVQTLTDPNGGSLLNFGYSLTLKKVGSKVYLYVVDNRFSGTNIAQIHYYVSDSVSSIQFNLQATFEPAACPFATSLAIDNPPSPASSVTSATLPILAVACPQSTLDRGVVYIYRGSTLGQTLVPATITSNDYFGSSVSIRWPYLVVGARQDEVTSTDNGAVYIYQDLDGSYTKPNFVQMTHFEEPAVVPHASCGGYGTFGSNVAFIDERSVAVRAGCNTGVGVNSYSTLFIYTLENTGWNKKATLSKENITFDHSFGLNLAGDQGIMVATKYVNLLGTTYVYQAPEY